MNDVASTEADAAEAVDIRTRVHGPVPEAEREVAERKLRAAFADAPRPVLAARLDLLREENPALERPAVVKAAVDVSGRTVRAHVARPLMDEAIDLAVGRIREGVARLADRRRGARHRTGVAKPGEWRHGDLPASRPHHFPRPPQERELVRHKSYAVDRISVEEAAFEMEMLDHETHLFRDAGTGSECAIRRRRDGELELLSADAQVGRGPAGEPAELSVVAPPAMALAEALSLLDATDGPAIVFLDRDSGRLSMAYLRFDGHHGLVTAD